VTRPRTHVLSERVRSSVTHTRAAACLVSDLVT
jgi:hypothetical protein